MEQGCFRSRLFRFAGLRGRGLSAGARSRLPRCARFTGFAVLHINRAQRGKAERPPRESAPPRRPVRRTEQP